MKDARFESALGELGAVKMTEAERASLRARLDASIREMEKAGGLSPHAAVAPTLPVKSPWNAHMMFRWAEDHRFASIGAAAVVIATLGVGGVALVRTYPTNDQAKQIPSAVVETVGANTVSVPTAVAATSSQATGTPETLD